MIPQVHESISDTLESWFGPSRKPTLSVRAPHLPSYSPPPSPPSHSKKAKQHINVLLLSETDGRPTMVDLTKTLAEMAQKDSLKPEQINADLIDAELQEAVSSDPDLLILFSPTIELKGYPPWQLRLTEILYVTFTIFRNIYNNIYTNNNLATYLTTRASTTKYSSKLFTTSATWNSGLGSKI